MFSKYWGGATLSLRYYLNKYLRGCRITKTPIFIVGCGHSGTSLLLAILGTHSKICAIPCESNLAFSQNTEPKLKSFDRHALTYGKSRWVEKTPKHITCIGRVLEICPGAKVLLILRDGRDVAYSIRNRTGSIEEGIKRWVDDNRAGREFWGHPSVYVVKYEDLITNFEATVSRILDFLDEEYENEIKEYYKTPKYYYSNRIERPQTALGGNHGQYRNWQINQPLFDGRGRWKQMPEEEIRFVNDYAKEMLIECGYFET